MKIKLLSAGLLLFVMVASYAQDAKTLLKNSLNKCLSIQNGYYEMDAYMKWLSSKDTSKNSYTCYFKKMKGDSLPSLLFHYKQIEGGEYKGATLYTGNELVQIQSYDSTATIKSMALWRKQIKEDTRDFSSWSSLTSKDRTPMPHDSDFIDNRHLFTFIGEEVLNNISCYHVQLNETPKAQGAQNLKMLRYERHFWINKKDLIPVQYSIAYDLVMNNDTMYQYEKFVLTKYKMNKLKDESIFTLSAVPLGYTLKDYVPYKRPDPLPKDTIAPNFKLLSVTDKEIALTDLKGKLVLLDFFYKSCFPCMQAMPALQTLHEKYKDKGLTIIGIDPVDKKEEMAPFLTKQGATYTVLLGTMEVAKDYRVSGYPTTLLIDKNGNIIFIKVGYDKDIEKTLEEVILKNL